MAKKEEYANFEDKKIFVFFYILDLQTQTSASTYGPSLQPEAYFNGSSYLRLQTSISLKKLTGLSFRTCYGGSLFSQQQNDYLIEVSLNGEGLIFLARTSTKAFEHKIVGNFINNRWHTVYLQYNLGNLTIDIDGETQLLANSSYRKELLISPGLYNEGATVLLIGKQFNGCLLEGPSIVFEPNIISSSHNVVFEPCPIPFDSCIPRTNVVDIDYCLTEPCMRHGTCINGQTTYTCDCLPRYTGKNCEMDMGNLCERKPSICKNSATCIPEVNGDFSCVCAPGFSGKRCEQEVKVNPKCAGNPCLNGGTCSFELDKIVCHCKPGYTGANCDINVDECSPNPCLNGGLCTDSFNNFTCDCSHTGYTGRLCDLNINECTTLPCLNGGTCFDTYGSYLCQCLSGYNGKNCQFTVDECTSQPCFNNAVCISRAMGGYECRCLQGFYGDHCEIEQRPQSPQLQQRFIPLGRCDPAMCPPHADCIESSNGNTQCVCKPEYPGEFPNCNVDNSPCAVKPCQNGGICNVYKNVINCTCPVGFNGKFCQNNVDECASNPCLNGGTCKDRVNGFSCNCTEDWMGAFCEKPYDICLLNPCKNNATCVSSSNRRDFTCICPIGFEGVSCEINVDDCKGTKCPPGQICRDLINDYECRCPPGYAGDDCSIDIDPCSKEPCYNGTCTVDKVALQFSCQCNPGFTGVLCDIDVDECTLSSNKICNHGICVNTPGAFQCYCMPGFTGERCDLDFDECLSTPCRNNASCENLVNNYHCKCRPGYEGKDCSINIDECASNPCLHGASCVDGVNDFTCICQEGLTGRTCETNIDDCASSPCQNGAKCIDGLNSYECDCTDTGYEGDHCEINIDDCKDHPCQNNASCVDRVKEYNCECYRGYEGINCEIDINECESNPCLYNGTCLERSDINLYNPMTNTQLNLSLPEIFSKPFDYADSAGYECICIPGVTGINCETNINECESNPCRRGTCTDKIGGYTCECEDGFEGEFCELEINECEKYTPCVHGECIDRIANYLCNCPPEYGGKNCSVELVGCANSPCLNNGICRPYLTDETEHRYNCSCPNGYHGHSCEKVTTMSLTGTSSITVNMPRDEGYDIQFRFKTTLGDGLLALGKGQTFYILELSQGRLNLQTSLLNKWEGVYIGSNLNDSTWQKVFVAINASHLVLSANDEQSIYSISYNENNVPLTSFPVTFIAGIPSNLVKLTHGEPFLVGCMEDLLINGQWVLPEMKYRTSNKISFQNVDVGCLREEQCKNDSCNHGGHCIDRWNNFTCTCERPHLGLTCQYIYTPATFGYEKITNSLVTVYVADNARRAVRSIVDISMFIRTRQPRGQIFYLGSGLVGNSTEQTYIAAELESGELLVTIKFNGSTEAYTVGGVKLDNGEDHLIEVIRNVLLVQVKINGIEYFRKTIAATGTLDAQVLYLGGLPQTRPTRQTNEVIAKMEMASPTAPAAMTAAQNVHFKGIIQDVQISSGSTVMVVEFFPLKVQGLDIPLSFGRVEFDEDTVLEGVLSDDSCVIKPCHHGFCNNTWNDYVCICPKGFKGKDCSEQEFCELQGCPEGAICNNLEDGYECISNSTFDGLQKPLRYTLNIYTGSNRNIVFNSLEISYRTRSWGTLLFAKLGDDYFIIFIYHNEVIVEWSFDKVVTTKRFRRNRFEGEWLSLVFVYKDQTLQGGFRENMKDESPNFEAHNFDLLSFSDLFKEGNIYVAGSDNKTFDYRTAIENSDYNMTGYIPIIDTTTAESVMANSLDAFSEFEDVLYKVDKNKSTDNFKGCLGEIRVGGLLLPYFTAAEMYTNETYAKEIFVLDPSSKIEHGCILCYKSDCFNNGFCINETETYKCNCQSGYAAYDCSVDINECENNQCENNATCHDLIAKYECQCLVGYEGEFCEIDIDECASNPCRHGGTCNDLIGSFKCHCPGDFVGQQCEVPLLITCESKPCGKGATCKTGPNEITGNNFTCTCAEGMAGPLCDAAFCEVKPCEHGRCLNSIDEPPKCECQRGYTGKFCEININECVAPSGGSVCQNGGICIDGIARYDCNCAGTGYTGLLCEMDIDECRTDHLSACGRSGMCENTPGSYRCICDQIEGKCGKQCDLDDPCQKEKPCEHGECKSHCTETPDYLCICDEGYVGKNCSDQKISLSQIDGGFNILYVVIPVVLILVLAFTIAMAILVNVARSKRATRGTYSPSAQEFCNPRVELDHVLKPPPEERLI